MMIALVKCTTNEVGWENCQIAAGLLSYFSTNESRLGSEGVVLRKGLKNLSRTENSKF
jgi:hypothetical protein